MGEVSSIQVYFGVLEFVYLCKAAYLTPPLAGLKPRMRKEESCASG